MIFDIQEFIENVKKSEQAAISIIATKGAIGTRTKEELIRLIESLPDEKDWGYSLVVGTK